MFKSRLLLIFIQELTCTTLFKAFSWFYVFHMLTIIWQIVVDIYFIPHSYKTASKIVFLFHNDIVGQ